MLIYFLIWKKINELEDQKVKVTILSQEEIKLILNKDAFKKDQQYHEKELLKLSQQLDSASKEINTEINTEINKSSFINIDFDFKGFVKGLTEVEILAFSGLILNHLILSYTISIILILYGDYLIKRFDLVNRYPKIVKLIQLRQKLQEYYLKIAFTWIFLCVLPQMAMYIYILMPKVVEYFS